MNTIYKSNNNIVYSCKYLVVWCSKYKRKVLTNGIEVRLEELLLEHSTNIPADILEIKIYPEHVQLLIETDPQFGIHKTIKSLKSYTSKILREEYPALNKKIPTLWTNSYYVSTIGNIVHEDIEQYIQNQKTSQRQKNKLG